MRDPYKKNIYEFLHLIIKQLKIARTDIYFFWLNTMTNEYVL